MAKNDYLAYERKKPGYIKGLKTFAVTYKLKGRYYTRKFPSLGHAMDFESTVRRKPGVSESDFYQLQHERLPKVQNSGFNAAEMRLNREYNYRKSVGQFGTVEYNFSVLSDGSGRYYHPGLQKWNDVSRERVKAAFKNAMRIINKGKAAGQSRFILVFNRSK